MKIYTSRRVATLDVIEPFNVETLDVIEPFIVATLADILVLITEFADFEGQSASHLFC